MRHYIETIKTIFAIAGKERRAVVQMFAASIIKGVLILLPPIATAGIIAVITNNERSFHEVWLYVGLFLIFYIAYFIVYSFEYKAYITLSNYYRQDVQQQLFEHVANNESIFEKFSRGKITTTCSEDVLYVVDIIDTASSAVAGFIQIIIIFLIFIYYNTIAAFIAFAVIATYLIIMNDNAKMVSKYYEGTRKYQDKNVDILSQMLSNVKQVTSLNMMPNLSKKLTKSHLDYNAQNIYILILIFTCSLIVF